jgi:hypothetical protein
VTDLGKQLCVDGETTVEGVSGLSHKTHGELTLEHEKCVTELGAVSQKLEGQRRRDLVGSVGDTDIEIGEIDLDTITKDDF